METPFVFGKIVSDKNFTDREYECERLVFNFTSKINTILISPRRWGKSSLVARASEIAAGKDESLRFSCIDLFNIRSEEQFYQKLAESVLKASSSRMDGIIDNTKKFLSRFIPRISFSPDSVNDFSLSLDWKEVVRQPDEILDLPENISQEKNLRFIICIDEFQNLAKFENQQALQKKLRSHWQLHQNTTYCLYGSKRHMLMDVFTSHSMPFYKFGDLIFLDKISEKHWIPFIIQRFSETGKTIKEEDAATVARLVELHPYYVQQLAQKTWFRTDDSCSGEIVAGAHENLISQLSLLFQTLTDELSNLQINFLHAVLDGTDQLSAQATLRDYNLGSSANVNRVKQALIKKEIIEMHGNMITFLDPVYKSWLKNIYFKAG